jgi:hypothetical protein
LHITNTWMFNHRHIIIISLFRLKGAAHFEICR